MADHHSMLTAGTMLQLIVMTLLGLAVVMVNSATITLGGDQPLTYQTFLFGRPTIYVAIAIATMLIISRLDIRQFQKANRLFNPVVWLVIISVVLCTLVLFNIDQITAEINGSRRWLKFGSKKHFITFQPSELAKWAVVLAIAWWGGRRAGSMRKFWAGLFPPLALMGLMCGLIIIEDLGTAVLIGSVAMVLLFACGARWWHLALASLPALGGVWMMIWTSPYRMDRLMVFRHPFADDQGTGYQLIQSLLAIVAGNRGLGNGLQKLGYLPTDDSDFLFAVICEEMGMVGTFLVVSLFLGLLWFGLSIIRNSHAAFNRILSLGIMITITLQASMNLFVVTGMVPTKGIALPLLSAGGTGWLMTAAAVGLLVAVDRVNRLEAAELAIEVESEDEEVESAEQVAFSCRSGLALT